VRTRCATGCASAVGQRQGPQALAESVVHELSRALAQPVAHLPSIEWAREPLAHTDEPLGKAAADDEFARGVGALLALERVALCVTTLP